MWRGGVEREAAEEDVPDDRVLVTEELCTYAAAHPPRPQSATEEWRRDEKREERKRRTFPLLQPLPIPLLQILESVNRNAVLALEREEHVGFERLLCEAAGGVATGEGGVGTACAIRERGSVSSRCGGENASDRGTGSSPAIPRFFTRFLALARLLETAGLAESYRTRQLRSVRTCGGLTRV